MFKRFPPRKIKINSSRESGVALISFFQKESNFIWNDEPFLCRISSVDIERWTSWVSPGVVVTRSKQMTHTVLYSQVCTHLYKYRQERRVLLPWKNSWFSHFFFFLGNVRPFSSFYPIWPFARLSGASRSFGAPNRIQDCFFFFLSFLSSLLSSFDVLPSSSFHSYPPARPPVSSALWWQGRLYV